MITLKWHGDVLPDNLDSVELAVLTDIKRSLTSLDKPSSLIFHLVPLDGSYEGPSVSVWGETDDDQHFHCEYQSSTEWTTLDKDELND